MKIKAIFLAALVLLGLPTAGPAAAQQAGEQEAVRLELRSAISRGIRDNFQLRVDELEVPIRRNETTAAEATFDPAVGSRLYTGERQILTGAVLYEDEYRYDRETGAEAGLQKRFFSGLTSGITFRTARIEENFLADGLNPEYHNFLVLNLSQPLLRGFGKHINDSQIRLSEKQVEAAALDFLDQAQHLALRIETTYFELAKALAILEFRIESRELARELMQGNESRLTQGVIAVTEVQQAETAVAGRDDDVIAARQQVETLGNRLKDLLEIQAPDPLSGAALLTQPLPDPAIPYPDFARAVAVAMQRRPDLRRLHIALDSQDIRLAYLANQELPRLDLGTTLGINGLAGADREVGLFGNQKSSPLTGSYGDSYASLADDDGYEWSIDLKLSYPLGNRAAAAALSTGKLEKRQLIYQLGRLQNSIETDLKNSLVEVERSLERVQVAEHFEKLARITLEQETARLSRGLSDTFRILNFQDDLIRAHIRRVNALASFHQGLANLYRAMGANLERYDIIAEIKADP